MSAPTVEERRLVPPTPRRLSTDLRELLRDAAGRGVSLAEIEQRLQGRGFALCIFLLAGPFVVPLPGLSTPFGIIIALLGLRIAIGLEHRLPTSFLRREVSFTLLQKLIPPVVRLVEKLERRIRPRMHFLQKPGAMNFIGLAVFSAAFILALPLPVPFSNFFPAISIMLLAAGMMERDGLLVVWGYTVGAFSWLYLAIWWKAILFTWYKFVDWFQGLALF